MRNLADGRVEAAFEGEETKVRQIIERCRQGPAAAIVKQVEIDWQEPAGFSDFTLRY